MRKRRTFDLDLPDEPLDQGSQSRAGAASPPGNAAKAGPETDAAEPVSAQSAPRRGPMAAAITETGSSLAARAETLAAIRAENDALAEAHVRARRAGLLAEAVPLEAIDTQKLIRDRARALFDDGTMDELKASLRDVGLSNPIRLEFAAQGRYELIQGWRRLTAYRALLEETGDAEAWGTIPAIVATPGEDLALLYRRMVDENMVRKDISFTEMAQLALRYSQDIGASEDPDITPEKAVAKLFKSAGYQKRSYIRAFLPIAAQLDQILRYPEEIPRALGLALAQRLTADDSAVTEIRAALKGRDNRSVADELAVLRRVAGTTPEDAAPAPPPSTPRGPAGPPPGTTFQMQHPGFDGDITCTAGRGRLDLRLPRDLSTLDRARLIDGIRALLDRLG